MGQTYIYIWAEWVIVPELNEIRRPAIVSYFGWMSHRSRIIVLCR